jgi:hypothetical protein
VGETTGGGRDPMLYFNLEQAHDLMRRLEKYEPGRWEYDHHQHTLTLRTNSGSVVEIRYRTWPDWLNDGATHNRQFHLSIQGQDIGAIEPSGKHAHIWDVIPLGPFYHRIAEHEVTRQRQAEAKEKKSRANEDAREKLEAEKRALLEQL